MSDLNTYNYIFLDRDGVINEERPNDYVKSTSEFIFIDGAIEAIVKLSKLFEQVFIVTNQRGVGKGVMSIKDLNEVHAYMLSEIEKAGGNIASIYFCSDTAPSSINRKPNVGMAFKAQRDFSPIAFNQSIMVGNSSSDIDFGNKLGMYTVLVGDKYAKQHEVYEKIDAYFENLYAFVESLSNNRKL